MISLTLVQLFAAAAAFAPVQAGQSGQAWEQCKIKTLVTFGDSYTDENRLSYIIQNNGSLPPVGWDQPVVSSFKDLATKSRSPTLGFSNCFRGPLLGALC
jgi:hypothetical protein